MRKQLATVSLVLACALPVTAQATSIILEGNYIKTAVNDSGTLGYGGTASPGILHDPSGTRLFGVDDYLTPGSPFEGFYIKSAQTGVVGNNNDYRADIGGILTNTSGVSGYDQSTSWFGTYGSAFQLTINTFFNNNQERINFTTTITALADLDNLKFLRTLDPDPDVNTYGSYDTTNGRAGDGQVANDWVHAEGASTGLTIGLFSRDAVAHNTGISADWKTDPDTFLAGTDDGNGDNTIGLAFDFGTLLAGHSKTISYSYVLGKDLGSVVLPPVSVPEPASMLLLTLGLFGLGVSRRKMGTA